MNFPDVKTWTIPEGSVKKVRDSQNRIIWKKSPYEIQDYVSTANGLTGIIIPINIPANATYEIMIDTSSTGDYSQTYLMGNSNYTCVERKGGSNRYMTIAGYQLGSFPNSLPFTNQHYWQHGYDGTKEYIISNIEGSDSTKDWTVNLQYTQLNYSGTYSNYWGIGVIATGASTYSNTTNYVNNRFVGNIYGFYIKVNNILVNNLVPALNTETGVYGLYDTITKQFHTSITPNAFTHNVVPITGITLYDTDVFVGETATITRAFTPVNTTNKTLNWSSSDTTKATIDSNGIVTGISPAIRSGYSSSSDHRITVTAVSAENSNVSNTCKVGVYNRPTNVTLSPSNATIAVGDTVMIKEYLTPSDAKNEDSDPWWSLNTNIATVSSYGRVTGVSKGSTQIRYEYRTGPSTTKYAYINITVTDDTEPVTGINVSPSTATIGSGGGQTTLTATVSPSNATNKTVTWTSSDTSISTVNSNGVVTGVNPGTATITGTTSDGGYTDTCVVTVQPIAVTGITLDKHSVSNVGNGDVISFTATISPANASNTGITVNPAGGTYTDLVRNGNVWTFNFRVEQSSGTASVSVRTTDGNKTDTCTISIISTVAVTGISLNKSSLSLSSGNTSQLVATVTPSNATNKTVNWSSSNTSVATVNSSGLVTAISNGNATITATTSSGGYTATCNVSVVTPVTGITLSDSSTTIKYSSISNITKTINATVSPSNASNKNVTWSSSNSDIVSVTPGGVIHGEALGTATITCASVSNPSVTATCTVTVLPTIIIAPASTTLNAGQTTQLSCTTMPSGISIQWVSSNTSVATVNQSGLVEGKSAGTANISAGSNAYGWSNDCVVTVSQSGDTGKSLTIANDTGFEIKYGKANNESTMSTLGSGNNVNVTLASGESLYILRSYSGTSIDLACLSQYSVTSGSYRITYANAEDGETIHAVVAG